MQQDSRSIATMMILGIFLLSLAVANGGRIRRVVGGSEAISREYPYQGTLTTMRGFFCSGTIINENWVLTAASCFSKYFMNPSLNIYFAIGRHKRSTGLPINFQTISSIVIHPDYKRHEGIYPGVDADIALLYLEEGISFNDHVQPIVLPSKDLTDYNISANFSGWGRLAANGEYPDPLQKIKLNLISNEECRNTWGPVKEHHLCTLNKPGEGTCRGDSGGPLIVDGVQVGIASYTFSCAAGLPEVFTKVFSYVDWIKDTVAIKS